MEWKQAGGCVHKRELQIEPRPQDFPSVRARQDKPGPASCEDKCAWCGNTRHLAWCCRTELPHRSVGQGFPQHDLEGGVERMDCSFGQADPELYYLRLIVDAQVRGQTLTAMVNSGCMQTLVHAAWPVYMASSGPMRDTSYQ